MRFLWLIGIAMIIQSCGAQWHLKRAIAKDPAILDQKVVRVDTTVITNERVVKDTIILNDTIVRETVRDNVRIRVQRIHDTIRVDVVCPPDTVRITAEVPVDHIIYEQKPMPLYRRVINVLYLILVILVGAWVYRLTK